MLFTQLPYSGVEVDVPFFAQEPAEPAPDGPLVPDVLVRWTAADVAAGRDPNVITAQRVLEAAEPAPGPSRPARRRAAAAR